MSQAVFDTNILIDYFSDLLPAKKLLEKYDYKIISIITYYELIYGAKSDDKISSIRDFLVNNFEIIDLDLMIAEEANRLMKDSITKKHKLKLPDCIILATSITQAAPLITRNYKDFEEYDNIIVPYNIGARD